MAARHKTDRGTGLLGLLHHPHLLRPAPTAAALHGSNYLNFGERSVIDTIILLTL